MGIPNANMLSLLANDAITREMKDREKNENPHQI
jgi:hypothetical protein